MTGASDARDKRHVQAPPRAVQSDIAAVGLPEGPGLAFKMRFYWDVIVTLTKHDSTLHKRVSLPEPAPTRLQATAAM